ncbi:hypothetical protein [Arthrobacter sp. KNU40]|uniref:hypothetical protein n=1 Tax=Arthrobacter sp. KNU40 TaxID=3447965 RepID=UPI003F5D71EF
MMKAHINAASVEQLNALSRDEAEELFRTLPAPDPEEFGGEYAGYTAGYLTAQYKDFTAQSQGELGKWLGKAFVREQYRGWDGHGYNIWEIDGVERRTQRFAWKFGTSMLDGGPCVVMHYAVFDNIHGELDLIDEVRSVGNGIFLATASSRYPSPLAPERGGPNGRALPTTFVLCGPERPCAGPDDLQGELRD